MAFNSIIDAIKYIINTYGLDELKNGHRCNAILSDIVPKMTNERKMLAVAFDNNLVHILISANSESMQQKEQAVEIFKRKLIDQAFLNENIASQITSIFISALDWNINIPSPNVPNISTSSTSQSSNNQQYVFQNISIPLKASNKPIVKTNSLSLTTVFNSKKYFIIGIIALIVLIAIISIISSSLRQEESIPTEQPTLSSITPTENTSSTESIVSTTIEVSEQPETTISSELIEDPITYLGRDITSYEHGTYYTEYNGNTSFNLGGVPYYNGFTIGTYTSGAYANYNLDGKYKYFSGIAGNVDGRSCDITYIVYGDGNILDSIEIKASALPIDFCIDVTGVKQLKIVADGNENHSNGVGFANTLLSNTLPQNDNNVSVEAVNDAFLGKDITSYEHGTYYTEYNGNTSFNLGGVPYYNGFTIGTYTSGAYANYNLDGKYKYFSGVAGNVDGRSCDISYIVYGDGNILDSIEIKASALPIDFCIDVTGVKQLKIVADGNDNHSNGVGFGNTVLSTTNKTVNFNHPKYPSKAILGKDIISYTSGSYYSEIYTEGKSILIQGQKYYGGITIGTYTSGAYANYNLDGKYKHFSGVAGNVDGRSCDVSYIIYGDGNILDSIEIKASAPPIDFYIDVTNVKHLKIVADGNDNHSEAVAFAELTLE